MKTRSVEGRRVVVQFSDYHPRPRGRGRFSAKFLESLPQRTKLSRDLTVIKENRAERVGRVQRLFDFDDSSVAKEGLERAGNSAPPYHSAARGILFIPGWYACSSASSAESLFSTLHSFPLSPSLSSHPPPISPPPRQLPAPPWRPTPRRSTIL